MRLTNLSAIIQWEPGLAAVPGQVFAVCGGVVEAARVC